MKVWWDGEADGDLKVAVVIAAAVVSAAIVLAIAYLLGSDVRGRAAAAVATYESRAEVAVEMVRSADRQFRPTATGGELLALPSPMSVRKCDEPSANEAGWRALAVRHSDDGPVFLVVRGSAYAMSPIDVLEFN